MFICVATVVLEAYAGCQHFSAFLICMIFTTVSNSFTFLGDSLGLPWKLWGGPWGSLGSPQGRVACRDEILEISGGSPQATHRQPVPPDACIIKGI